MSHQHQLPMLSQLMRIKRTRGPDLSRLMVPLVMMGSHWQYGKSCKVWKTRWMIWLTQSLLKETDHIEVQHYRTNCDSVTIESYCAVDIGILSNCGALISLPIRYCASFSKSCLLDCLRSWVAIFGMFATKSQLLRSIVWMNTSIPPHNKGLFFWIQWPSPCLPQDQF